MDEKDVSRAVDSSMGSPGPFKPENVAEAGSREAFLTSFTPEDDRHIMRKVDKRFLLLIGVLYLSKTVSTRKLQNAMFQLLTATRLIIPMLPT